MVNTRGSSRSLDGNVAAKSNSRNNSHSSATQADKAASGSAASHSVTGGESPAGHSVEKLTMDGADMNGSVNSDTPGGFCGMNECEHEVRELNEMNAGQSTEREEKAIDSDMAGKSCGVKQGVKPGRTNELKESVMAKVKGVGEGEGEGDGVSEVLQSSIKAALMSKPVIDTIVKAVSTAISEKVSNDVYKALEFDLESKMANVTKLEKEIATLKKEIKACHEANEEQEQYSRRNCLRFHGIPESQQENTDDLVIKVIKDKLQIDLKREDLDRSHRIPVRVRHREGDREPLPKPIIVKFIRYNRRKEIYDSRSKLKGTAIYIHEDLTRVRSDLLFKARSHDNVKRTWTYDGRIFALTEDGRKVKITKDADLERLD